MGGLDCGRLKELRKQRKETQADLAALLHISKSGYNKIENGNQSVDAPTLSALANHFGVSTDYLLNTESEPLPVELLDLASRISKLPPDVKNHILQQIALFEKMDNPK